MSSHEAAYLHAEPGKAQDEAYSAMVAHWLCAYRRRFKVGDYSFQVNRQAQGFRTLPASRHSQENGWHKTG